MDAVSMIIFPPILHEDQSVNLIKCSDKDKNNNKKSISKDD